MVLCGGHVVYHNVVSSVRGPLFVSQASGDSFGGGGEEEDWVGWGVDLREITHL